jgi:hypothetical protein
MRRPNSKLTFSKKKISLSIEKASYVWLFGIEVFFPLMKNNNLVVLDKIGDKESDSASLALARKLLFVINPQKILHFRLTSS